MICPSCKHEIVDGSIICPICNTQFAFTVPGLTQTSNPNLYEVVENNAEKMETLDDTAYSPNANVMPTEVTHYPEEEINPDENALKYAQVNQSDDEIQPQGYSYGNVSNINTGGEYMHISGQNIDSEPYNPASVATSPIRPEPPQASASPSINQVVQNQMPAPNIVSGPELQNPNVSNNTINNAINNNGAMGSPPNMVNNTQVVLPQGVVQANANSTSKKKFKTEDIFFGSVSIVGLIIIVVILVSLANNSNKKQPIAVTPGTTTAVPEYIESNNIGVRSTFNYAMKVGNTTLASIYDEGTKSYYDVDVKGLRFIEGTEAVELAKNYAKDPLIDGFAWYAFEYQVTFNDLNNISSSGISPVLSSKLYMWLGATFVTYNEENYTMKTYDIYNYGPIANKKSATVKVVYQMPITEKEYSICFGYIDKTMGCFTK